MTTTIRASVHVSPECEIDVRVDKLKYYDNKYIVLSMDKATIFLYSRDKVLEIAKLLEQAAQELEDEDDVPN